MTIDLTGVATSFMALVVTVLSIVLPRMLNHYMTDKTAAAALGNAVKNSLGALVQDATAGLGEKCIITIPGVSPALAPAVRYVLTHAGDEAAHFGITPVAIADKISAQIGLEKIAVNGPDALGHPPA